MAGDAVKMNLGCGGQVIDGWTNIDRAGDPPVVIHDLRDPLPFADGSVEMAVAHHVLDLLEEADLRALLVEVHRVLVPGGVLRVSSADHEWSAASAEDGRSLDWYRSKGVPADDIVAAVAWYRDWGGARRTVLDVAILDALLNEAGFKVEQVAYNETTTTASICDLDSREDESWFVEATKP